MNEADLSGAPSFGAVCGKDVISNTSNLIFLPSLSLTIAPREVTRTTMRSKKSNSSSLSTEEEVLSLLNSLLSLLDNLLRMSPPTLRA
ncbi:hypothetical protein ACLOJK_028330 [Asimina triloba]